ncbi:relaxase/mobilization nuclease domain-containing protein [Oscillospiraceae bacterium]
MPIIHFINNKSQSAGGMRNVLAYVSKAEKTEVEDKKYVTALNCSADTAYEEFNATKNLYHKNGGRLYYHLVQSFPSGYEIAPELAHKIAVEFANRAFKEYECVVATHIDREHIHSHIVFNSVSFEDGKKYHSDKQSVEQLMKLSDEICQKYGVQTLEKQSQKQKKDVLSDREYRSAVKGESWKFQLMSTITEVMKKAKSKKQFCFLMRQYGYGVRWEDNRKYITYTCPTGQRCRDKRLHGEKFSKEMMQNEFEIRYAILNGEEQGGLTGGERYYADDNRSGSELVGGDRSAEKIMRVSGRNAEMSRNTYDGRRNEKVSGKSESHLRTVGKSLQSNSETDGRTVGTDADKSDKSVRKYEATDWENERRILLQAEELRRMEVKARLENAQSGADFTVGVADIIDGVATVATMIEEPTYDDEFVYHEDSKLLSKERRHKEELGMKM